MRERDQPTDETGIDSGAAHDGQSRRAYMGFVVGSVGVAPEGGRLALAESMLESSSQSTVGGYGEGGYGEGEYGGSSPEICNYTDQNGILNTSGLLNAIDDWRDNTLDTGLLIDVINAWRETGAVAEC
jgi:hypothetical protein